MLPAMSKPYKGIGEDMWKNRIDKVNVELFTLTYGSIVAQLLKDYEDFEQVNIQLDKMGYNIGTRLVEDFLARSGIGKCQDFKDTAEVIARVGFKAFLNVTPTVTNVSADGKEFSLILDENPLADFVELPEEARAAQNGLWYSNILCGVLRGALEMVQMHVDVSWVSDVLKGGDLTELRVKLIKYLEDEVPAGED
ncbi:hypothetical protein RI367_006988 [Sorochytrium milnesiophthora]